MAKDLRQALVELQAFKPAAPEDRIIFSEGDIGISPKALAIWFLTARINADPVATLIAALVTLAFDSYFVFH